MRHRLTDVHSHHIIIVIVELIECFFLRWGASLITFVNVQVYLNVVRVFFLVFFNMNRIAISLVLSL